MRSSKAALAGCWGKFIAAFSVALLAFGSAVQAEAPESLVSLVPSDAGVCVELNNLAEHGEQFQSGQFFRRLEAFPPVAEFTGEYSKPFKLVLDRIANHLGETTESFLKKIFGQQVVLGAWPAADGGSIDDSPGLILMDAQDADLLGRTIKLLSQGMPVEGEAAPPELTHAGLPYHMRRTGEGESQKYVYMTALESIGILTNSETVMQSVLELYSGEETTVEGIDSLALYREARSRVPRESTITAFTSPKRWNSQELLSEIVDEGLAPSDHELRRLLNAVWQASSYSITGIQLGEEVRLSGFLHVDQQLLEDSQKQVLASLRGDATFMDRVPREAILAASGNIDIAALVQGMLAERGDAEEGDLDAVRNLTRGMFLGLDLFDEVLPALGPQFGIYLVPEDTPEGEEGIAPAWVAGVQTQATGEGDEPSVSEALQNGLKTLMNLAAGFLKEQGQDPAEVRVTTTMVDGVAVTSLEGVKLWPEYVVATVAAADDFVMLGTSREAVIKSLRVEPQDSLGQCERFRKAMAAGLERPSQVIYIDCERMREVIENNGEAVVNTVVQTRRLDEDTARRSLDQLNGVIALADHLLAAVRFEDAGIAYGVTFTMDSVEEASEEEFAGAEQE